MKMPMNVLCQKSCNIPQFILLVLLVNGAAILASPNFTICTCSSSISFNALSSSACDCSLCLAIALSRGVILVLSFAPRIRFCTPVLAPVGAAVRPGKVSGFIFFFLMDVLLKIDTPICACFRAPTSSEYIKNNTYILQ